MNLVIQT